MSKWKDQLGDDLLAWRPPPPPPPPPPAAPPPPPPEPPEDDPFLVIDVHGKVVPRDVVMLFDSYALKVTNRGFARYSSDAILHRIRWHYHIERGDSEFKCNNNWTSALARWWLRRHPEYPEFFELRERVTDGYSEAA